MTLPRLAFVGVMVLALAGAYVAGIVSSERECEQIAADAPIPGEEMLALINGYRSENGLGPLSIDVRLQASAQWFAEDLVATGRLEHIDSQGRDLSARVAAVGYPANSWLVENLAQGPDAASVFASWRGSASHDANLRSAVVSEAGIGHAGGIWVFVGGGELAAPVVPVATVEMSTPASATAEPGCG